MEETKKQLIWNSTLNAWQEQLVTVDVPSDVVTAIIYRQGGPSRGNSVFSNFTDAIAAINAAGVPATLYIDGTMGQPFVPAGDHDLSLITLSEFPGQLNVTLNLLDGAKFSAGPPAIMNGLSLYSLSNSPIIQQSNVNLSLSGGSWLQTSASGSFIDVPVGGIAQVFLDQESYLAGTAAGSTAPIINAESGSIFTGLNVGNWSDVGLGSLSGSGQIEVNLVSTSATIETQVSASHLTVVNANVASVRDYASFFAMMPGDNSETVGVGVALQFPQDGPTTGVVVRMSAATFNLTKAGAYEITWQASINEPAQLQLAIDGVGLPHTVVGRATGTNQLFGNTIIVTTSNNSVLSVINPLNNSTALTVTPVAGGTNSVSATLTIKSL